MEAQSLTGQWLETVTKRHAKPVSVCRKQQQTAVKKAVSNPVFPLGNTGFFCGANQTIF